MSEAPSPLFTALAPRPLLDAVTDAANRAGIGLVVTINVPAPRNAYVNDAAVEILRWSREELLERPVWSLIAPEDLERLMREWAANLEGEPTPLSGEADTVCADGSRVTIEYACANVAVDGQPATVSFIRDVSERRRADAERARMATQLVSAERLAAVGSLASGLAHEINNPLGYIGLNLESLTRALPSLIAEPAARRECEERLERIREGIARITEIVADLGTFATHHSRVTGAIEVAPAVELACRLAAASLRPLAPITFELEPVPRISASHEHIAQVLLKLFANMTHAFPVSSPANAISVRVRQQDGKVTIEVADNGAGIAPDVLPRIFEPFFTTEDARSGLGLWVAHKLVHAMGGSLKGTSVVGEGTTFRITLPAS
ncbi:MAG: PAS domain S-box protein [Myxococcales bacterium]|nr:PAS domain S-box protein [Myxococcales bacterium]